MKQATIHFITGGQRSGKSKLAQKLALLKTSTPIYIATARIWDKDFEKRVEYHKNERGENWTTLEIPVNISQAEINDEIVVLDCVTLWLTNLYFDNKEKDINEILKLAKAELSKLFKKKCELIIISNEIGMGGHSENEVARKFTDLQGWVNQFIASKADKLSLMISGIAIEVK